MTETAVKDRTEIELHMSNFDGEIDKGFAEALKAGHVFGRHAGWNFNGKVWFEDGKFHEEVWCFHVPQEVISKDTLEELMETVNEKYGYE